MAGSNSFDAKITFSANYQIETRLKMAAKMAVQGPDWHLILGGSEGFLHFSEQYDKEIIFRINGRFRIFWILGNRSHGLHCVNH
jgi:hypothetical protein